ncbi:MAG: glutathione S-transferase [Halioglobus sp.]|jgi:glutathione S-transferase
MILYTFPGAPNPRRVVIFANEKGIELDMVDVNIMKREQKSPPFMARNPSGKIPTLELEDGTCIAESIAISRYLEALHPEPNLFGNTALETALIEMQHRFIELELFSQIGVSWVNGPIIASTGLIEPIDAAKSRSDAFVGSYYERLDQELGQRPYIAGERYTIADITAFCAIEFAASLVELKPDEAHQNLWAWHERVSVRDSVRASQSLGSS